MRKRLSPGRAEKANDNAMRKFKCLFMTMLAVAVCCGFTACGDDDEDEPGGGPVINPSTELLAVPTVGNTPDALLGKWTFSFVDDEDDEFTLTFQFKHRGICTLAYDDEQAMFGSCKATGNTLTLDFGGMIYSGSYSISGNTLTFKATVTSIDEAGSYTMELPLTKVSSETGYEPAPVDDALVGVWYQDRTDVTHRFTFLSNGLAQYLQQGTGYDTIPIYIAYSVEDGEFTCYDCEGNKFALFGALSYPYSVNGNTLLISANGETLHFTK